MGKGFSRNWRFINNPLDVPNLVAWYQYNTGITTAGSGVSVWADQSGNGNDLLQGTDTNRPAYLAHSGTNYLWMPGPSQNFASTPDTAALDILGDIDLRAKLSMDDWTPAVAQASPVAKWQLTSNRRAYVLVINTDGTFEIRTSTNGTTVLTTTSTEGTGFTDGTTHWIRATLDVDNGAAGNDATFYTYSGSKALPEAADFVQLGDVVTTAGTTSIGATTSNITLGGSGNDDDVTFWQWAGKLYRAQIYDGIDGTLVFDADFSAEAEDTTSFTESSAQGATVTVNQSGGWAAQLVGSTSILFDGVDNYLKATAFTLNQPTTVYLLGKQVTWTLNDSIFDGNTNLTNRLYQSFTTPKIRTNAGSVGTQNNELILGSYGVVTAVFNGAASSLQVNNNAATTEDFGSNNAAGFTLGAQGGGGGQWSNIQVKEVIIYNVAHNASQTTQMTTYLNRVGGGIF